LCWGDGSSHEQAPAHAQHSITNLLREHDRTMSCWHPLMHCCHVLASSQAFTKWPLKSYVYVFFMQDPCMGYNKRAR
jgi:hypothetical protein